MPLRKTRDFLILFNSLKVKGEIQRLKKKISVRKSTNFSIWRKLLRIFFLIVRGYLKQFLRLCLYRQMKQQRKFDSLKIRITMQSINKMHMLIIIIIIVIILYFFVFVHILAWFIWGKFISVIISMYL